METFSAVVCAEGSTGNLRVTVPHTLQPKLATPGWARIDIGGTTFFGYVRRPPSRPTSATVTLPKWRFPKLHAGIEISASIEDAARYRATGTRAGFDWLPFVPDRYFPTEFGTELVLHNQHEEPFILTRSPALLPTYRLLGVWQAEGTKGARAPDFTLVNTNPMLLAHIIELLSTWGVSRERLYLEVLRAADESAAQARRVYTPLGVEIAAERARKPGTGGHAGLLHVHSSTPLLRLARAALVQVFEQPFPSPEAAREYALGWLDGDAAIVDGKNSKDLRLAGYPEEHAVVKRALTTAFGWVFEAGSHHRNLDDGTHITLRAEEMLQLLDARAFPYSMNRVRLFLAFGERAERLDEVNRGERSARGAFGRWGLLQKGGGLTSRGCSIVDGWKRYEHAVELARCLRETRPELFGVKGIPYPPEMEGL